MASGRTTTTENGTEIGWIEPDHGLVVGHPLPPFKKFVSAILTHPGPIVKSARLCGQAYIRGIDWESRPGRGARADGSRLGDHSGVAPGALAQRPRIGDWLGTEAEQDAQAHQGHHGVFDEHPAGQPALELLVCQPGKDVKAQQQDQTAGDA